MNPHMSYDVNFQKNVERLRYQIREWNYANRKTVEDKVKEAVSYTHLTLPTIA